MLQFDYYTAVSHQSTSIVPYEKPSCRVRNTSLALNSLLVNKLYYDLGNVTNS